MKTAKRCLKEVAGFTPTQQAAFQQGIGSFQPFLQAAQAVAQTAGLGTIGQGAQPWQAQTLFQHKQIRQVHGSLSKRCYSRSIKRNRQTTDLAQNRLAGQAVKAGAFGGSRFGIQQSELARNAADLKTRRIFEDLSRNFQQAQAASRAANQQRLYKLVKSLVNLVEQQWYWWRNGWSWCTTTSSSR